MQNESELSHCQTQSQTVLYPTKRRCRRRSRSRSAWLSSNCDSILMAEAATETATAAQCPSIGESVLTRQRLCVCMCMCLYTYARSLGFMLVTVTQSWSQLSLSLSFTKRSLSLSAALSALAEAAAAQRFLLLYSWQSATFHFISI